MKPLSHLNEDRHQTAILPVFLRVAQSAQANLLVKVRERLCSHVDLNFCRQLPAFLHSHVCMSGVTARGLTQKCKTSLLIIIIM